MSENGLGPIDSDIQLLCSFDTDDEFFHVTCNVEPTLKTRIQWGEFVDLEKLLPKDWSNVNLSDEHPNQLELVSEGGHQYVAPYREKNLRINGIRKWDQAFRVYAAIYCDANPARSGEIWQYIHVIHTAASSYPWDSVQHYDLMFHQLMGAKP